MFLFVNVSGKFILFFIFVGLMVFFFFLVVAVIFVWFGLKWFWEDLVVVSTMTYDYD